MLAQSVKQKFVLLEIVAACAVLAACGGGGDGGIAGDQQADAAVVATAGTEAAADGAQGDAAAVAATADAAQGGDDAPAGANATAAAPADSSEQAAAAADPDNLAPAAGEPAWGSMEATSESYGDTATTAEEPVLRESGPSEEAAVDAANQTPDTADGSGRESAQSLSIDSSDLGYAKPKVAALDYSSDSSSTKASQLAKYRFVILGGRSASAIASLSSSIHSRRSSAQIAAYTIVKLVE